MSIALEPRKVDKPFLRRWLRITFELFVRSPVRFSIVNAALGWLDTSVLDLAQGYAVQRIWIDRLGMLVLPLLASHRGPICSIQANSSNRSRRTSCSSVFGRDLAIVRRWHSYRMSPPAMPATVDEGVGANALAFIATAYGMTTAAFLVFMGVLNYVAYRDIFERRGRNLPKTVAALDLLQSYNYSDAQRPRS